VAAKSKSKRKGYQAGGAVDPDSPAAILASSLPANILASRLPANILRRSLPYAGGGPVGGILRPPRLKAISTRQYGKARGT